MAPYFSLIERAVPEAQGALSQTALSPVIIAGIVVACVLGVGVALWLGIRYYRKRSSAERESQMGSGFLSVRGVVKEGEEKDGVSRYVQSPISYQLSPLSLFHAVILYPLSAILFPLSLAPTLVNGARCCLFVGTLACSKGRSSRETKCLLMSSCHRKLFSVQTLQTTRLSDIIPQREPSLVLSLLSWAVELPLENQIKNGRRQLLSSPSDITRF